MMDCLHSMAPDDEQLISYALDGDPLPAREKEHLEQCTVCQRRLARYKDANQFLLAQLYRSQCPTATKLSFYCAGLLPADEVMSIAQHLEQCPLCAQEAADTRRIFANFDPVSEVAWTPLGEIRRIIASLVPWKPQLVTRDAAAEDVRTWPRQYRADAINISLHLSRASNGETMLLGLLTSANSEESIDAFEGANVELYSSSSPEPRPNGNGHSHGSLTDYKAKPILSTIIDDLGNIVFKSIPAGEYTMIIYLPDSEVVIEALNITAP